VKGRGRDVEAFAAAVEKARGARPAVGRERDRGAVVGDLGVGRREDDAAVFAIGAVSRVEVGADDARARNEARRAAFGELGIASVF
jgi:hypothetical protein